MCSSRGCVLGELATQALPLQFRLMHWAARVCTLVLFVLPLQETWQFGIKPSLKEAALRCIKSNAVEATGMQRPPIIDRSILTHASSCCPPGDDVLEVAW